MSLQHPLFHIIKYSATTSEVFHFALTLKTPNKYICIYIYRTGEANCEGRHRKLFDGAKNHSNCSSKGPLRNLTQ